LSNNDVLTLGQASRIAGCSRDTVRRAAQKEELRAEMGPGKKGPQWWIRQADLTEWLQFRGQSVAVAQPGQAQEKRVRELEQQLSEYERQARQARQELTRTRAELRLAQQRAADAAEQLKTARGLVENWSGRRRVISLRGLLGL
jgi:Tfp pilus assembly protein FimV